MRLLLKVAIPVFEIVRRGTLVVINCIVLGLPEPPPFTFIDDLYPVVEPASIVVVDASAPLPKIELNG